MTTQTKNDVYSITQELKKKIPSFYSIPVNTPEEEKALNEKNILGAIVIQDGEWKDHVIIIRSIELKEDLLQIDYTAIDKKNDEVASCLQLDEVVGNLINYFLASERLKDMESEEKESV